MSDPWSAFVERAADSETAGYFERPAAAGSLAPIAVSFTRADAVRSLGPRTDPRELAKETERFLRGGPRRVVVGYAGFDAVGLFEPALARYPTGSPFPLGEFLFASRVDVGRPREAPRVPPGGRSAPEARPDVRPLSDSLPRARYERSVRRLRAEIRDGEAFQVVLAHRRAFRRPTDLLERAGALRATERYAFFYYLRIGDRELVGASPESVVEVDGRHALINPIAGTIPAGAEGAGRLPLAVDPKELSEHRMLVDLARNDLGRIARPRSVRLPLVERRVRYARLEHLVSRVACDLQPGVGPWEALGATFPAGTVSGAPKIRATELLRREEATWRGPYAGAVGLLRPRGRADWALAIRSAFASGRRLYTAAGAGIVYRSEPRREFLETLTKLSHLEQVVAGGGP